MDSKAGGRQKGHRIHAGGARVFGGVDQHLGQVYRRHDERHAAVPTGAIEPVQHFPTSRGAADPGDRDAGVNDSNAHAFEPRARARADTAHEAPGADRRQASGRRRGDAVAVRPRRPGKGRRLLRGGAPGHAARSTWSRSGSRGHGALLCLFTVVQSGPRTTSPAFVFAHVGKTDSPQHRRVTIIVEGVNFAHVGAGQPRR